LSVPKPILAVAGEREIFEGLGIALKYLHGPPSVKLIQYLHILLRFRPETILSWSFYANAFCTMTPFCDFIGALRGSLDIAREQLSPVHFVASLRPSKNDCKLGFSEKTAFGRRQGGKNRVFMPNMFERKYSVMDKDAFTTYRNDLRKKLGIAADEIIIAGVAEIRRKRTLIFSSR